MVMIMMKRLRKRLPEVTPRSICGDQKAWVLANPLDHLVFHSYEDGHHQHAQNDAAAPVAADDSAW